MFVTEEAYKKKNSGDHKNKLIKKGDIWGSFTFHEKNLVMALVLIVLMYKLTYRI